MPRVFTRAGHLWLDYHDASRQRVREPARAPDGTRLKNRAAADRLLKQRLVEVEADKRDPFRRKWPGHVTLTAWLEEHEREHVARMASAPTRRMHLRYWRQWFGPHATLASVTRAEVERYMAGRLADGYRPSSVLNEIAALSKAMNVAVQRGMIPLNPCTGVRPPRFDNRRNRHLTAEEEAKLLEAASEGPPWLVPFLLLAIDAGGRVRESRHVLPSDVDWKHGILTFRVTKSRKIRHVPLTSRLAAALREWFARGEPFPSQPATTFLRYRDKAGLGKDVTHHILRHTFGTRTASASPLHVVKELMGHADIRTTMIYAHVADGQKRAAIAALESGTNQAQIPIRPKRKPRDRRPK